MRPLVALGSSPVLSALTDARCNRLEARKRTFCFKKKKEFSQRFTRPGLGLIVASRV